MLTVDLTHLLSGQQHGDGNTCAESPTSRDEDRLIEATFYWKQRQEDFTQFRFFEQDAEWEVLLNKGK